MQIEYNVHEINYLATRSQSTEVVSKGLERFSKSEEHSDVCTTSSIANRIVSVKTDQQMCVSLKSLVSVKSRLIIYRIRVPLNI